MWPIAPRGVAAHGPPRFGAHFLAYAEMRGIGKLPSEDFQNDRLGRFGGEWSLATPLVFKTSQPANPVGGFDSHQPPP